jgi:hypothetical protein
MHSIGSTYVIGLARTVALVSVAPLATRDTNLFFPLLNGFPTTTNPSPLVATYGTLGNGGPFLGGPGRSRQPEVSHIRQDLRGRLLHRPNEQRNQQRAGL